MSVPRPGWTVDAWEDLEAEVNPDALPPDAWTLSPDALVSAVRTWPDTHPVRLASVRLDVRTPQPDAGPDGVPDPWAGRRTPDEQRRDRIEHFARSRGMNGFVRDEAQALLGVGRTKAWELLRALVHEGLLCTTGGNRGTHYHWAGRDPA